MSSGSTIRDPWLRPVLAGLLSVEAVEGLEPSNGSYWEAAVQRGLATDDEILTALASRFRMKLANVANVSTEAREKVPEALARKYRVLPLAVSDSVLDIATADPHDLDCERTLAFATGRTVRMSLAAPSAILRRIDEVYRPEDVFEKILQSVGDKYDVQAEEAPAEDVDLEGAAARAGDRPVIRLVDHIIAEGISSRGSDIHVEPEEGGVAVRYRIDGVLREAMMLPRAVGVSLVSRIKIMSNMDIADRMRPQDGRARVNVNGARVDLRVSTLPAAHGEKVVIRILDARSTVLSLETLGFNADEYERIMQLIGLREGLVLVTGPTGSGKTTTLYSMLRQIQARNVNIVTVEDPVEYRLQGIVQVQVNEKAGLDFAAALRSILRQDPDVVLVGEVRDKETASTAAQAALTGHLVLTTLHTIDAASSVARLVDIGIESYKVAAALKGIIAQRLLRKICHKCREVSTDPVPDRVQQFIPPGTTLYRAVGCDNCSQTGYRGRMAITEVVIVNKEIERRVAANESALRLQDAARESGARSLWDSGVAHVKRGDSTLEELLRVVEVPKEDGEREDESPSARSTHVEDGRPSTRGELSSTKSRGTMRPTPSFNSAAFQLIDEGTEEGERVTLTVLLVEDEEPLRKVLRDLLDREGYKVLEAGNGVQALDQIDRGAPDVVLLDLNIPQLDGYGVLHHLRNRPQTSDLPVIVLTARGDEESEVRALEMGATDFLTKPFRPRALNARLQSLARQRRASR
jgi:type II secretory ATPase GspE/PulE/Tfp pilus assembly ATPase PilB-like protein/ActR/RegA family two-component response regulator